MVQISLSSLTDYPAETIQEVGSIGLGIFDPPEDAGEAAAAETTEANNDPDDGYVDLPHADDLPEPEIVGPADDDADGDDFDSQSGYSDPTELDAPDDLAGIEQSIPASNPPQATAESAEEKHARKLNEAEQEYLDCNLRILELEETIESAKEDIKAERELARACGVRLRAIRNRDPIQQELPIQADGVIADYSEHIGPAIVASPAGDDWRRGKISDLSLTAKQIEKLEIAAGGSTIGDLVDYTARVAENKADWPERFGKETQSKLEDQLTQYMTRTRDAGMFQERRVQQAEAVEGEPVATKAAAAISTTEEECLLLRSVEIAKGPLISFHQEGTKWFDEGGRAFSAGQPVTSCPYCEGECQDDWLRGWHSEYQK
jgi:hypothetical protein